jgi:predicted secreted hydrolase
VARPDYAWSFPGDHWARPGYRTEWWYFTGHLGAREAEGLRFGYQFTLFRVGVLPAAPVSPSAWSASDVLMGHAAVTDLREGRHRFGELLYRATPLLAGFGRYPDPLIAWSRAAAGTGGTWTLRFNGAGFDLAMADRRLGMAFELATRPAKPLVLQGPGGFSRKGEAPGAGSQYYSFTRLRTEGVLALDGRTWTVRGESWMDKEFGSNPLGPRQVGWDWFALQLADGRELMLYRLREASGRTDFASGTLVAASGAPRYLGAGDWSLSETATWTSPATRARYPARWIIAVPADGLRLEVVPELAEQENRSRLVADLHYWEGAVRVLDAGGARVGRGYVELVGYGTARRPAL